MLMSSIRRALRPRTRFKLHLARRAARRYHAKHASTTAAAYCTISTQTPERALSPEQEKLIRDYSRDVFGSDVFAPWLRVYTAWRGRFLEGWMPDNYFGYNVLPAIQGAYRGLSDLRCLQAPFFGTDPFPDLLYFANGRWITPSNHRVLMPEEVAPHIFADHEAVFVKLDISFRGRGVHRFTRETFDPDAVAAMGNGVVQAPIRQAAFFDELMPDNVATVRVMTLRHELAPARKYCAYLRLGRRGAPIVLESTVKVPFAGDDGLLADEGLVGAWERIRAHPDTGTAFEGRTIPHFAELVATCERLHDRLPHIPLIGWDATIDHEGRPRIMEWNTGHPGISFLEASMGPNFAGLGWERDFRNDTLVR